VTIKQGCTLEEAHRILQKSRKGKLPVVDENFNIVALVSRTGTRVSLQCCCPVDGACSVPRRLCRGHKRGLCACAQI
jgi:CBS-domain-containing membrane protein